MIHIAIVNDDKEYIEQIRQYVEQYERDGGESIKLSVYDDGDSIVYKYRSQYDIVVMDVEMRFMDGISAAEEIRKNDPEVVIILISSTTKYAIRGYSVEALDYLLKPVSYPTFSQCIDRAITRIRKRKKAITVNIKGGIARFDSSDIYYVESRGHSLIYYTVFGEWETVSTMKEAEAVLCDMGFFRASKWYLVNVDHVNSFKDGCINLANKSLSVSRAKQKELLELLRARWCT